MSSVTNRFFFFLWPPYEAYFAEKAMQVAKQNGLKNDRSISFKEEVRKAISNVKNLKETCQLAEKVYESEVSRKKTLEDKASSFQNSISFLASLLSVIPAIFARSWINSHHYSAWILFFYVVGLTFLWVSVYYAIKVRQVTSFALPTYNGFINFLRAHDGDIKEWIVLVLTQAKLNECALLRKSNYLAVTERLFLRGLALIIFAALLRIGL